MIARRQMLLRFAAGAAGMVGLPAWASFSTPRGTDAAAHALNRLGFGPAPGDLALVAADPSAWVEAQLAPRQLPLPAGLLERLKEHEIVRADPIASVRGLIDHIQQNQQAQAASAAAATPLQQPPDMQPPAGFAIRAPANPLVQYVRSHQVPAIQSRLLRALQSPRQLEEVMVDFWFNHFNVFSGKNWMRVLVGHYEHYAIRPYAMGRFADLLKATAHHPAMLYYLDNWTSVADRGGARGLNENYARELMELHTLGVDGGYTQADVTQLARMLTGWSMVFPRAGRTRDGHWPASRSTPPGVPNDIPGFQFYDRTHDSGSKTWLGRTVEARGKAEGDWALEVLAAHPATARHIAFKLAQYFVADQPDAALVDRLARVFQAEDGQIVPVLRALFTSDAFWSPGARSAKFKTPYHYALSTVRATGFTPNDVLPMAGALAAQGMPLYGCPTPDGWRNTEGAWLNPDAMGRRIQYATQLARLRLAERADGGLDLDTLFTQLGPLVTPATRQEAEAQRQNPPLAVALVLAGPGMMRR